MSTKAATPPEKAELNKAYRGRLPLSQATFSATLARNFRVSSSASSRGGLALIFMLARRETSMHDRPVTHEVVTLPVVANKYGASYDSASRGGTRVG
jgi:hypothetical protein